MQDSADPNLGWFNHVVGHLLSDTKSTHPLGEVVAPFPQFGKVRETFYGLKELHDVRKGLVRAPFLDPIIEDAVSIVLSPR